jgi:hypothetical protein
MDPFHPEVFFRKLFMAVQAFSLDEPGLRALSFPAGHE